MYFGFSQCPEEFSLNTTDFSLVFSFYLVDGNNDSGNVEPRNFNAEKGHRMNTLRKDDKCSQGPALDSSWKASFKILDSVNRKELNEGFCSSSIESPSQSL
ncbi:uncharacterized protein LOC131311925 [Rhododendron vialii]|uniref:uncharacterized protein LOC131311925 n=1 Tax=Rhododendron vialii TaxID=182163 RepID=UPI00265E7405|nr:uncharacterized protein LOC131311925 [Rhododendron vialii]